MGWYFVFLIALFTLPVGSGVLSACIVIISLLGWWLLEYLPQKNRDAKYQQEEVEKRAKQIHEEQRLLSDLPYIREVAEREFYSLKRNHPLAADLLRVRALIVPPAKIVMTTEEAPSGFIEPDRNGNKVYASVVRGFDNKNRLVAISRVGRIERWFGQDNAGQDIGVSATKYERKLLMQNGVSVKFEYGMTSLLRSEILDPRSEYGDFINQEEISPSVFHVLQNDE